MAECMWSHGQGPTVMTDAGSSIASDSTSEQDRVPWIFLNWPLLASVESRR